MQRWKCLCNKRLVLSSTNKRICSVLYIQGVHLFSTLQHSIGENNKKNMLGNIRICNVYSLAGGTFVLNVSLVCFFAEKALLTTNFLLSLAQYFRSETEFSRIFLQNSRRKPSHVSSALMLALPPYTAVNPINPSK
jgi:hypothetical protein